MKTIKNEIENTLIINNSKFICSLYKVYSVNDIDKYLNIVKNKYKDATHYCYAYIIDNEIKVSDDNEPSGTAGMPIREVLVKNNLNYVLCVVTRYFGGIKLGAGGLIRAYSNSVSLCLSKSTLLDIVNGFRIEIEFNYDNIKDIDYLLKNEKVVNKRFDDKVFYVIETDNEMIINSLRNYKGVIITDKKNIRIEV